MKQKTRF